MQPDVQHGWKPDEETLKKIPSLTQFKSPRSDNLEQKAKAKRKAERTALLAQMLKQGDPDNMKITQNSDDDDDEDEYNMDNPEESSSDEKDDDESADKNEKENSKSE